MRTVVLTTSYPRTAGDAGGHFVAAQAKSLLAERDDVHVVAPGRAPGTESRDGVTIHWTGGRIAFGWPGVQARLRERPVAGTVDAVRALRRSSHVLRSLIPAPALRDTRVVAHWILPSVWPLLASLPRHVTVEAHAHGADVRLLALAPPFVRHALLRRILARVASVRFASESLRCELLGSVHAPDVRESLVAKATVELPILELPPQFTDPGPRRLIRERVRRDLDADATTLVAVAVGRLIDSKRLDLAIDAVAAHPHAHLVLVGDGPARATLEHRARPHAKRIHFAGALDRTQALGWMAAADVLVHPSKVEAAPTAVREARALDRPVIACPSGDILRWAAADPAIHCVDHDPGAIRSALDRIPPSAT